MTTSTLVGAVAIRPRIEPVESDGATELHEFDLPSGAGLPIPDGHDAYETNGGGPRRCVWQRARGEQLRCVWA